MLNLRAAPLSEFSGDIVFSLLLLRLSENRFRARFFDDFTFEEKCSPITTARRLLHVMRYDHNCVLFS